MSDAYEVTMRTYRQLVTTQRSVSNNDLSFKANPVATTSGSYNSFTYGGTQAITRLFVGGPFGGQYRVVSTNGVMPLRMILPVATWRSSGIGMAGGLIPSAPEITYEQVTYHYDVARDAYIYEDRAVKPSEPELLPDPEYRKRLEAESGF